MTKKWEYYDIDSKLVKKVAKENNISELLATILVNRNILEKEEIKVFLSPTRNNFHDPFLLPDMGIAVERLIKAINQKEQIMIYGDYDVDGITSIGVLKHFLQERGMKVDSYIPNRLEEGYGLNKKAIDEIHRLGHKLIITVDCGISGIEEVEYANSLGIQTIITDHHETSEDIPNAIAVVNAKRKDNKYPFRGLAGVGVVFKLIQAIGLTMKLEEKEYLKYLDLVCVGTISDIVPLVDENRVIAKLGLKLVEVTKNPGLASVLKVSGFKRIDSNAISFGVAPRINACGRMGYELEALELFMTNDTKQADKITEKLNQYNKERQETEKRILQEAIDKIEKEDIKQDPVIILEDDNWHHGVIGIVSSKITDMYFKPSVLLCFEGEEAKGSRKKYTRIRFI